MIDELNVKRSEKVEVLNDKTNRWLVKNRMGAQGYVPAIILEGGYITGIHHYDMITICVMKY